MERQVGAGHADTAGKEDRDIGPLLEIVRPLMADKERESTRVPAGSLREAWKIPEFVEAFLMEYKDTSPRLIFQYATEKMAPEQKAVFKAQKKNRA